jgi:hypothetical protein
MAPFPINMKDYKIHIFSQKQTTVPTVSELPTNG